MLGQSAIKWWETAIRLRDAAAVACRSIGLYLWEQYDKASAIALARGERAPHGVAASLACHLIILLTLIVWAQHANIGGSASHIVAVDVVVLRAGTNTTAHSDSAAKPAPASLPVQVQQPNAVAAASPPREKESEPAEKAEATSPAAQQSIKDASIEQPAKTETRAVPPSAAVAGANAKPQTAAENAGAPNGRQSAVESSLSGQIVRCWSVPMGVRNLGQLALDFIVFLNPDGTVERPPELTPEYAEQAPHDPQMRAAADALRQAIYSCAPYKLPADEFADWHEINPFHFDPVDFLGR
jgi:hypothetical protein